MARHSKKRSANPSSSVVRTPIPAATPSSAIEDQTTTPSCSRRLPIPITPGSSSPSSSCSLPATPVSHEPEPAVNQDDNQEVDASVEDSGSSLESFIKEQREINKRLLQLLSENDSRSARGQKRGPLPLQLTVS